MGRARAARRPERVDLRADERLAGAESGRRSALPERDRRADDGAAQAADVPRADRARRGRAARDGARRLAAGLRRLARHADDGGAGALLLPAEPALLRGAEPHDGAGVPAVVADEDAVHRLLLRQLPRRRPQAQPVALHADALGRRRLGAVYAAAPASGSPAESMRAAGSGLLSRIPHSHPPSLLPLSRPRADSGAAASAQLLGVAAVLLSSLLSGFANVYLEKRVKRTTVSIWMRNVQLGLFGIPQSASLLLAPATKAAVASHGLFVGFDPLVWSVVALKAIGGLLVAAVVKVRSSSVPRAQCARSSAHPPHFVHRTTPRTTRMAPVATRSRAHAPLHRARRRPSAPFARGARSTPTTFSRPSPPPSRS